MGVAGTALPRRPAAGNGWADELIGGRSGRLRSLRSVATRPARTADRVRGLHQGSDTHTTTVSFRQFGGLRRGAGGKFHAFTLTGELASGTGEVRPTPDTATATFGSSSAPDSAGCASGTFHAANRTLRAIQISS